jgi:hypothetical protein
MKAPQSKNTACNICGKTKARARMMPAAIVRNAVAEQIKRSYPDWKPEGYICLTDMNQFRMEYIQNLLESEKGELTTWTMRSWRVFSATKRFPAMSMTSSKKIRPWAKKWPMG